MSSSMGHPDAISFLFVWTCVCVGRVVWGLGSILTLGTLQDQSPYDGIGSS